MPKSDGPQQGTRQELQNDPRESGTTPPQQQISTFEVNETVHLRLDPSVPDGRFHPRFNGLTGEVVGKQGAAYQVQVTDGSTEKTLLVGPAHLTTQE